MRIVIDISQDRYDEIMAMDWKNCRRIYDEEIRAIHDGTLVQEPKTDYKSFCEWVAEEIIDEENWKYNADAFPEIACRKLYKLGIMNTDGKRWIYENEALEQEPCEDCISREAVMDCFKKWQPYMATRLWEFEEELKKLPPVNPQEPKTDVLDRIRAEIKQLPYQRIFGKVSSYSLLDAVIEIIDKYRQEG